MKQSKQPKSADPILYCGECPVVQRFCFSIYERINSYFSEIIHIDEQKKANIFTLYHMWIYVCKKRPYINRCEDILAYK